MYSDRSDAWERALNDPKFLAAEPEIARLRLLELYDDTYGIVNHDTDPSPFSLASHVDQEDALAVSGYAGYLDEYTQSFIYEIMGINWETWMKYTYAKQKMIVAAALRQKKKMDEVTSKGDSDLFKAFKAQNSGLPK